MYRLNIRFFFGNYDCNSAGIRHYRELLNSKMPRKLQADAPVDLFFAYLSFLSRGLSCSEQFLKAASDYRIKLLYSYHTKHILDVFSKTFSDI